MKTIGLLGGVTWHSTLAYYRIINECVAREMPRHSASLLIRSVDFGEVEALQNAGDWRGVADLVRTELAGLVAGGAEVLGIASNTLHQDFETTTAGLTVPVLHIADAVAGTLQTDGVRRAGLLGTRFLLDGGYYAERLGAAPYGIEAVLPDDDTRADVHRIIFDELARGVVTPEARTRLQRAQSDLRRQGAEGVVLACSELGLAIEHRPFSRVFDTTRIHAEALAAAALAA